MTIGVPKVIRRRLQGGARDQFHLNLESTEPPVTSGIRLNIVEVEVLYGKVVHTDLQLPCPICLMSQITTGEGKADLIAKGWPSTIVLNVFKNS